MEIYVKISFISIFFYFSLVFRHDFISDALILPVSQLQTQQAMTSQFRSHIENLIYGLLRYSAHFVVKINEKSSPNGAF